jgi:hypothetical protein
MGGLDALENRATMPPYLSENGMMRVQDLSGLIGHNGARAFRFTSDSKEVLVTSKTNENVSKLLPIRRTSIGSVEGKLEAVNLHKNPRFIVYQSVNKKAVVCSFDADRFLAKIRESLGKRVVVSGNLHKNVAGDTLRADVSRIRVIGEENIASVVGLGDPYFSGLPTEDYLKDIRG